MKSMPSPVCRAESSTSHTWPLSSVTWSATVMSVGSHQKGTVKTPREPPMKVVDSTGVPAPRTARTPVAMTVGPA